MVRSGYRRWRYHQSRNNVVILLESEGEVRRWLRATPDTHRVGLADEAAGSTEFDLIGSDAGTKPILARGMDPEAIQKVVGALNTTSSDFAVIGIVDRPPLFGRGTLEPEVRVPAAIAIARPAYEEISGAGFPEDMAGLYRGARASGARIAILPGQDAGSLSPTAEGPIQQPAIVIVSGVPMHDVGGGSRGAQLALQMARAGLHVFYVSLFPSFETVDLGLRFVHPRLEQHAISKIAPRQILDRVEGPGWVLLELPNREAETWMQPLRDKGWKLCYDIIDRWSDSSLGGDWYDASTEERLIRSADRVVASASDLTRSAPVLGVEAVLVPNAVNASLFGPEPVAIPADFPEGSGPVIGYHGSLYGDWIDWTAIRAVAERYPDARLVMIGDVSKGHPEVPANVHFLGLKAQYQLSGYVARFDVGLLPFVPSETTHAVSPLKVYEYLASGVPVAAPPLRALQGLDGIFRSEDLVEAVDAALTSARPDPAVVLRDHTWAIRVAKLIALMGLTARGDGRQATLLLRPVVHYDRENRVLS